MHQSPFKRHPAVNTQKAAKRIQKAYIVTKGIATKIPTRLAPAKIKAMSKVNFLGAFTFIKFSNKQLVIKISATNIHKKNTGTKYIL